MEWGESWVQWMEGDQLEEVWKILGLKMGPVEVSYGQVLGRPRLVNRRVELGLEIRPEMARRRRMGPAIWEQECFRARLGSPGKAGQNRGSPGSALVQVPLLVVSAVPSAAGKEAAEAASGAVTVLVLQLRRPGPGAVVSAPRLQAREQKIRPRRGRKGRPSRARPHQLQQKQRSEACQCWPS